MQEVWEARGQDLGESFVRALFGVGCVQSLDAAHGFRGDCIDPSCDLGCSECGYAAIVVND